MAGLAAGLLVVAAAITWQFIDKPSSTPVVMVAAADQSPRNSELAQDLLVKLGSLRAAKTETFLLARIDPTEANVRRAMAEAQRRLWTDPRAYSDLMQTAGVFHREDELYELLLGWPEARIRDVGEVAFRPTLSRFRQDRRFMQIAARAGLIEYWRTSGKWPDFCFESELPYDCKEEAAKLDKKRAEPKAPPSSSPRSRPRQATGSAFELPAAAATSAAKSSCFFSMPSPS